MGRREDEDVSGRHWAALAARMRLARMSVWDGTIREGHLGAGKGSPERRERDVTGPAADGRKECFPVRLSPTEARVLRSVEPSSEGR